jgi:PIN domain nuclease of toxin-antitoxin system
MKLLLDTHIWLWSLLDRERISSRVFNELSDSENELWLSPISTWEIIVLSQKRRISLDKEPEDWVADKLRAAPVTEAPITHQVAMEVGRLRLPHRDPADYFLVATAKVFDLTLVTADERLLRVKDIAVLANR